MPATALVIILTYAVLQQMRYTNICIHMLYVCVLYMYTFMTSLMILLLAQTIVNCMCVQ
jgi:hypothetical protein